MITDSEDVIELPDSVAGIKSLLAGLRGRGEVWQATCADECIQATVNKEFAELFTVTEYGDEVRAVPKPQNACLKNTLSA